jgi:hypothetical protein
MKEDYIEYLREASNTNSTIKFGEQSLKRKSQLHNYYRDTIISNNKIQYEFASNILGSIQSVVNFFNKLVFSSNN